MSTGRTFRRWLGDRGASTAASGSAPPLVRGSKTKKEGPVDLRRRRDQLEAQVAELQFDLGGLVYEMAIRNRIRIEVLVARAAALQDVDAELAEVQRILHLEESSTAGACAHCGAPHSSGAAYCWQCGRPLLVQVPADAVGSS
ncbi:MAG: hypothetical protein ACYCXW_10140 [Solirubrobacteraceae bacterium]